MRLENNNSEALLGVQVEVLVSDETIDEEVGVLGLNDILYLVPQFSTSTYLDKYPHKVDCLNGPQLQ